MMIALMAMFAFSTPAEAQWGSLLNKARKAAGIKTKQEKAVDAEKHRQDSIQAVIRSITPTIPQPAKSGAPIAIRWQNTQIGTWDPVKLEITFNKTYEDGELAGQKVSYKLDPSTGVWTSKKGTNVGQISNDGTIQSPNLGTIKFDPEKCTVTVDGEVVGKVNLKNAYVYDTQIGGFDGHVSPLLVAYTFHGALISKNQIAQWKEAKQKADLAAKERAEKAAKERALRAQSSSSSSSSSSNREVKLYRGGSQFGELRANGDVYIGGSCKGELRSNGDIYVGGSCKGEIRSNGAIYKGGSQIGEVRSNGAIYERGSQIGEVRSNGAIYKGGSQIGEARGMSDPRKVAVIYFFGFF
jgi:cytoskeletal protein CcmA (bactofilin family)